MLHNSSNSNFFVQKINNKEIEKASRSYEKYDLKDMGVPINNAFSFLPNIHKRKKEDMNLLIGVKRGQKSFRIRELEEEETLPQRIPREDGRLWSPEEIGEGGYFEEDWRNEEELRKKIIEKDPNYQFLVLVAGATNAKVEQLYEEVGIER